MPHEYIVERQHDGSGSFPLRWIVGLARKKIKRLLLRGDDRETIVHLGEPAD